MLNILGFLILIEQIKGMEGTEDAFFVADNGDKLNGQLSLA